MQEFDAVIIGSGQAGNPLSHQLADRGWRVALVEREHLGGSCINYGCTPTKAMIASARAAHEARRAAELGVVTGEVAVDMDAVIGRKDRIVEEWREGQAEHIAKRESLRLFRGTGRFVSPDRVAVGGDMLEAHHIFIDTGTRARVPPIAGLDDVPYLTNKTVIELRKVPEHLLILGGGYLGLEFGQMFRRFGSRVTVIERDARLLRHEDDDITTALRAVLEEEGIHFVLDAEVTQARRGAGEAIVLELRDRTTGDTQALRGTHLLLGAGRTPNTDDLNLDAAGIQTDDRGYIKVDEQLRTNVEGIFALGDVNGGPQFTHISYNDYQIVYHNLFNSEPRTTKGRLVPYTIFTDPELGRVGITETEALRRGHNVLAGSIPMSHVARAVETGKTAGLLKLVVDGDSELILGAAMLSDAGGELVQNVLTAMRGGLKWTAFCEEIYIHPTLTEGFFALMDSVSVASAPGRA